MLTRITTLAALVVLTISHTEAWAQSNFSGSVGSNKPAGFKGVGSGAVPNKGKNDVGFNLAKAQDLTQQIQTLTKQGFVDVFKGKIALDAKDKQRFLDGFRVATGRANALQKLLAGKGVTQDKALQLAKQLESFIDQLRDDARDTGNEPLRDLTRELDRLSDRLVDVID